VFVVLFISLGLYFCNLFRCFIFLYVLVLPLFPSFFLTSFMSSVIVFLCLGICLFRDVFRSLCIFLVRYLFHVFFICLGISLLVYSCLDLFYVFRYFVRSFFISIVLQFFL